MRGAGGVSIRVGGQGLFFSYGVFGAPWEHAKELRPKASPGAWQVHSDFVTQTFLEAGERVWDVRGFGECGVWGLEG